MHNKMRLSRWALVPAVLVLPLAVANGQSFDASACSSTPQRQGGAAGTSQDEDRPVSLGLLIPNLICDQKNLWTFPARIGEGHNWIPTVSILGTATGLFFADPTEARYFHQTSAYNGFTGVFSSNATEIGTIALPAGMYAAGLLFKDTKMAHTALLSGEAVADVEVLGEALKYGFRRARPYTFQKSDNYWDSWFEPRGTGSFPSGHSLAAFAVATVVAHRYRNHKWVPYAAYGLAAAIGFSRLAESEHFASDVFVGAALGYTVTRFDVLRY